MYLYNKIGNVSAANSCHYKYRVDLCRARFIFGKLQETKTCYACRLKEHLIKSCKKNTNLFAINEEWPNISEEELKYFLEEYGKISSIKTRRNRFLVRNEALVCYRTAEEAKKALGNINMYQGWTAELYRSTSKDEQKRAK